MKLFFSGKAEKLPLPKTYPTPWRRALKVFEKGDAGGKTFWKKFSPPENCPSCDRPVYPSQKTLNMRDESVDIAKGIGILAVLGGHCGCWIPGFPAYSFHMPLFYFISGFFIYEYIHSEAIGLNFLRARFAGLLAPFFLYNLFFCLLTWLLCLFNIRLGLPQGYSLLSFKHFFAQPFIFGNSYPLSFPLWFIPSLFCVMLLVFLCKFPLRWLTKDALKSLFLIILLCLAFYWLARPMAPEYLEFNGQKYGSIEALYLDLARLTGGDWPWSCPLFYLLFLKRTATGFVFCLLGMLYYNKKWRLPWLAPGLGLLFYTLVSAKYEPFTYLSVYNNYGEGLKLLFSLPFILSAIFIVLGAARLLAAFPPTGKALAWLGRQSYHIMALHIVGFFLLNLALCAFLGVSPASFQSPNHLFHNIRWQYFLAGLAFCLLALKHMAFLKKMLFGPR